MKQQHAINEIVGEELQGFLGAGDKGLRSASLDTQQIQDFVHHIDEMLAPLRQASKEGIHGQNQAILEELDEAAHHMGVE